VAGACSDRGGDDNEVGSGDESSDDTSGGGGEGQFGNLESPCGEGGGDGSSDTTAAKAGQAESETLGVTDDSIAVGTVSDPGFSARPGLNQEIFDAGEAFVEWCNEQGGINGRELVLTQHDAAFTEYQARLEEACQQDFAIVGDGVVQDNLWLTAGRTCDLIDIAGFATTPEKAGTAGHETVIENRVVQPVPNPSDEFPGGAIQVLAAESPENEEALQNIGILYGDFGTTIVQKDRSREAYEQLGGTVVHEQAYNVAGEANWAPFAQALQEEGVEWLNFVGEGENLALLQQAMSEINYSPTVTLQDSNFYDPNYLEAAGPAAEGTYIRSAFVPFEERNANPATDQYMTEVEAIEGKVALLGAQSWSGWLLFAQSAKECDDAGDLTRTCVLETAGAVEDWEGGGLHAPTNPGLNSGTECTMVMQVQDGAFVRHLPEEGFECDPAYILELEGDFSAEG
jgi:hypothetical protein